jgi:uncharacterized phage-associated protein
MAAFFLEHAPGKSLNDIKLMKLLYIADRESLRLYAMPISQDDYVSMEHGPVLSATEELLSNKHRGTVWGRHISDQRKFVDGHDNSVTLLQDMDYSAVLRPCEVEVLARTWDQFKGYSKWEIKKYCHDNFREYDERAEKLKTSIPLTLETVFVALGDDDELAHRKAAELRSLAS